MAAADDGRSDIEQAGDRTQQPGRAPDADRDHRGSGVDRGLGSVKHDVDRIADKVKGLLRSRD